MLDRRNVVESRKPITRSLTYLTCTKHGIAYPKGATCPQCAAEKPKRA